MARKLKSARHKNYALYYLLQHSVFMAKLIGVCPVTVDEWDFNSKPHVSFIFQKAGLIFTSIQLLILAHMVNASYKYLLIALTFHSATLLQVMCVASLAITRTLLLQSFSFLYRTKEVIRCLNKASYLLRGVEGSNTGRRSCTVCVTAYLLAIPTTLGLIVRILNGTDVFFTLPFIISNFQENVLIFMIIVLFETVQLSLEDINRALNQLIERCVDLCPRLEKLMMQHSQTCNLFDSLSQCFGPDIALICCYNLLKNVLLTYYSYFLFTTGERSMTEHLTAISDVPYRFLVIWYLGFKCDIVTIQGLETRRLLAELATDKHHVLDEVVKETIKVFSLQMRCRKIQFSACGLFILNRAILYGMLQMSVTYIVVLIQFHSFINFFQKH